MRIFLSVGLLASVSLVAQGCRTTASSSAKHIVSRSSAPAEIVFTSDGQKVSAQERGGAHSIGPDLICTPVGTTGYSCNNEDISIQWESTSIPAVSNAKIVSLASGAVVKSYACRGAWPQIAGKTASSICSVILYDVWIAQSTTDHGNESFVATIYGTSDDKDKETQLANFNINRASDNSSLIGDNNDYYILWKPSLNPDSSVLSLKVGSEGYVQLNCTKDGSVIRCL